MRVIEIKIENDNLYRKIVSFLKSLKITFAEKEIKDEIDFSKYKINSFKNIDSVSYQREIRDEW
jgi:hypothetical protein